MNAAANHHATRAEHLATGTDNPAMGVQSPDTARISKREVAGGLGQEEAESLAEIMRALASPLRLRILSVLRAGPQTVTAICDQLGSAQAAVSNNLRLLRHLDLVAGERQGRHVYYRLFDQHVSDLLDQAVGHALHLPKR